MMVNFFIRDDIGRLFGVAIFYSVYSTRRIDGKVPSIYCHSRACASPIAHTNLFSIFKFSDYFKIIQIN